MSDRYVEVRVLGYGPLTVSVWEKGTSAARIGQRVDDAHAANENGKHRAGFCLACAEEYVRAMEES